jgi:uncharacterized OsmC-like protein
MSSQQTQDDVINGVPCSKLMETVEAVRQEPELGAFVFRAENHWITGGHNQSRMQNFYGCKQEDTSRSQPFIADNDEPHVLLGSDAAPNPVEWILHALAGCLTSTLAYHAAARGIAIRSIQSHLEGELDLQGFLGLSNRVPRGYKKIKVQMHVASDADAEKLKALSQYSPVFNTLTRPTPVEVEIIKQ